MPAVMISAEVVPTQGPSPTVIVYVDGQRAGAVRFHDWHMAYAAAQSFNDDIGRSIRATLRTWLEIDHAGQRKE